MALQNLKKRTNAASGFGKIFIAPFSDISAHATLGTITSLGDAKILTTAPTFKTSKGWIDLGIEIDLSKLDGGATGEFGSVTRNVKLEAEVNGLDAQTLDILDEILKDELAVVVFPPELLQGTGNPMYIGDPDRGARATWKLSSGAVKGGGKKGAVISFEYNGGLKQTSFSLTYSPSVFA